MNIGYYPGCSLHSTGCEYDHSLKAVCNKLDLTLNELKGWTCCGATAAHLTSDILSYALPLRNLILAESQKIKEIMLPCAACLSRFKKTTDIIKHDAEMTELIKDCVDGNYQESVNILHPLEVLGKEEYINKIKQLTGRNKQNYKIVCYYGCLLTRPPEIMNFDEAEYPESMDRILTAAGIKTLDWSFKTDCCGASMALTRTDIVLKLSKDIFENAQAVNADAIAVACSMCHSNLDTRQQEINAEYGTNYNIPVLYFSQLLGLSFGLNPKKLSLQKHLVSSIPLLTAR